MMVLGNPGLGIGIGYFPSCIFHCSALDFYFFWNSDRINEKGYTISERYYVTKEGRDDIHKFQTPTQKSKCTQKNLGKENYKWVYFKAISGLEAQSWSVLTASSVSKGEPWKHLWVSVIFSYIFVSCSVSQEVRFLL